MISRAELLLHIEHLLSTCELNLDTLEPETARVVNAAREALDLAGNSSWWIQRAAERIRAAAGRHPKPYQDALGVWSVGYGHACQPPYALPLDDIAVDAILASDIKTKVAELEQRFPWFHQLNDVRREALLEMHFSTNVLSFPAMLDALAQGQFTRAAFEALDSNWRRCVGQRAREIAFAIENGTWDVTA